MERKRPKYLSPTALSLYSSDTRAYYKRYCTNIPREPQTLPMAVGSAFDATVKCAINEIFKIDDTTLEEELGRQINNKELMADARKAGQHLFEAYKAFGGWRQLLTLLRQADMIKFECRSVFELNGVPVMKVPDLEFSIKDHYIILDYKVNGYCSRSNVSPQQGYIYIRDCVEGNHSRGSERPHKLAVPAPLKFGKFQHHDSACLLTKSQWATQLATYAYEHKDNPNCMIAVEQFVGNPDKLRLASHLCYFNNNIGDLELEYAQLWERVHSDHFFLDLSEAESKAEEERLQKQSQLFEDEDLSWFREMMLGGK